ncbi:hypothetical protein D3C76_1198340 [compost metagenome]
MTSLSLKPSSVWVTFSCLANAARTWRNVQPSTRVMLYCTISPRCQTPIRSRTLIPGAMRYSPTCNGVRSRLKRQYRRNQKASLITPLDSIR